MTNTTYASREPLRDEIDLISLLQSLWAQKWLIAITTLVVTLGAASFAFLSKPVYEARIGLLPPTLSDIADFNVARGAESGLEPFSAEDIFAVFIRNLQAEESRRQFFQDVYLPSLEEEQRSGSQDILYKQFAQVLRVKAPTKGQQEYVITVEHQDPLQAAEFIELYINQVTRQALDDMVQNTRSEVDVMRRQIQQQIKSLRESAKARRVDRVVKLREALVVAETVGLANPPVIGGQIAQQLSAFMDGDLMYMRGTKALRAEIEVLEKRASDDPFIPSLRDLQEKHDFYTALRATQENVAIYRQDGPLAIPDAAVKPKKAVILVLGVLLGGILGILIALTRQMFSNRYVESGENSSSASWPIGAT